VATITSELSRKARLIGLLETAGATGPVLSVGTANPCVGVPQDDRGPVAAGRLQPARVGGLDTGARARAERAGVPRRPLNLIRFAPA